MSEFWAKTGEGDAYLPLRRHLADAAAVAARLWDVALTQRQREWIAKGLGLDVGAGRRWISFLAGAHDIGKATPVFQRMVPELANRLLTEELRAELEKGARYRHDQLGGSILLEHLIGRGLGKQAALWLVATISGHHGQLRSRTQIRAGWSQSVKQAPAWRPSHELLLSELEALTGAAPAVVVPRPSASAAVVAVAGLISVSDWLASDIASFPVTAGERASSQTLAGTSVNALSWSPEAMPAPAEFAEIFAAPDGTPRPPRATQRVVADVVAGSIEPRLLIVEDRTGSGKTEAALWAVRSGLLAGARGFYIGLPTKATADQLHARTAGFVKRLWPESTAVTRLLHSGVDPADAWVQPREVGSFDERAGEGVSPEGDRAERDAAAEAWFAARRRGLLAPYAVGTIDQALMATVNAKHFAVRLWGLQGKVVVFDEVHSFDAYTSLLIERAVEWFAALDCTVVLLSATLPAAQRAKFASAFQRGLAGGAGPLDGSNVTPKEMVAPYPRVTSITPDAVEVVAVDDDRPPRTVELAWANVPRETSDEAVTSLAAEAASDGGCVAVVCNTVASAQQRYRALRASAPEGVKIVLLHARMRPCERGPVERQLMRELGPEARLGDDRPGSLIVVATQIIEQSLDLDFDVMFTDLAPIDLLVQRAGRVHRHARNASERPARHQRPRLVVVDAGAGDPFGPFLRSSEYVYVPALLCRTRLALRGRVTLTEPTDLDELIEAVYGDGAPLGCTEEELVSLSLRDAEATNERNELKAWAKQASIGEYTDEAPVWDRGERPLADPEDLGKTAKNSAATRWSERPSLSIVVLREGELEDTRHRPRTSADAAELLQRSVSLSSAAVVKPLVAAWQADREAQRPPRGFQPPAWRKSPRLRDQILIELDEHGRATPLDNGSEMPIELDLTHDLVEGIRVGKDAQ